MTALLALLLGIIVLTATLFFVANKTTVCPITIFSPLPLTGIHATKGQYMSQAAKLFEKKHTCVDVVIRDSASSAQNTVDYIQSFVREHKEHERIILGPSSSNDIQTFIHAHKTETELRSDPIWSQVVATEQQSLMPALNSVFFSTTQYLRDLSTQLNTTWPGHAFERVVVLRESGQFYYDEIIEQLTTHETRLARATITTIKHDTDTETSSTTHAVLAEVDPPDLLIVLAYDHSFLKTLANMRWYQNVPKVFIYGNIARHQTDLDLYRNSLQSILYDPNFSFDNNKTNCTFVSSFKEHYGRIPDFHGAYLYATLEAALQSKHDPTQDVYNTIIGSVELNENGMNVRNYPSYLYTDTSGKKILYTQTVTDLCQIEHDKNIDIQNITVDADKTE